MISKEAILHKHGTKNVSGNRKYYEPDILNAMSEHAEQMAIGFAEWIDAKCYERLCFVTWSKNRYDEKDRITTKQLYLLYLEYLKTL